MTQLNLFQNDHLCSNHLNGLNHKLRLTFFSIPLSALSTT